MSWWEQDGAPAPEQQQPMDHGPGDTADLSSMPPPTAAAGASGAGMGAGMVGGLLAGALVLGGIGYTAVRGGDDGPTGADGAAVATAEPTTSAGTASGGAARVLAGGTLCERYLSFWEDAPYAELMYSPDGSAPSAEFLDDPEWLAIVLPHNAWMADGFADLLAVATPRYRADLEAVAAAAARDRDNNYPSGGSDWDTMGGALTSMYDSLDRECGL